MSRGVKQVGMHRRRTHNLMPQQFLDSLNVGATSRRWVAKEGRKASGNTSLDSSDVIYCAQCI